jgi:TetR/AcrR family tetracycline transcriptional repressor
MTSSPRSKSGTSAGKVEARSRVRKPRTRSLDRKAVVAMTLQIIDRYGLEAVNLRFVAKKLGVKAPSLYNHFDNKSDLLSEVARMLLLEARRPKDPNLEWREYLVEVSVEARRVILAHHKAAPLLFQFFPREILLTAYEVAVQHLRAPPAFWMMVIEVLEKFTFGSALFAAAALSQHKPALPPFDVKRLPGLAEAIAANPFDPEELFVESLRRFLKTIPDAR